MQNNDSGLKEGPISQNDFMQKLVAAKKVMNKVDAGNYQKGNINENSIISNDNYDMTDNFVQPYKEVAPQNTQQRKPKLPDAIAKSFNERPPQNIEPFLKEELNMDFFSGAKRLIEQESGVKSKPTQHQQSNVRTQSSASTGLNEATLINLLTPIIENTVRKVMDEKLNQILTAQDIKSINESLVLKVGDTIFKGKLTSTIPQKKKN